VLSVRVEPEEHADEEQGRARRPGLRAAGGGVLHGEAGGRTRIAGEGLGQAVIEEDGGLQDAERKARRLCAVPVASQAPGDERGIMRPDGADVVPDGTKRGPLP
jgi:hypothetical protein